VTDQSDTSPVPIRTVRPDDDLDAQLDLAERSFGPTSPAERDWRRRRLADRVVDGRTLGAFDGDRPAASATIHDMRQWWCGRAVPMAGVGGVMVAPEDRGRGLARRLMAALLDEVAARGYPLSALYPATMPLYRSLGWELAGERDTAVVPARSLRDLLPPDPAAVAQGAGVRPPRLRRAVAGDAEAVNSVIGQVHASARDCGPITWDAASVANWLTGPELYAYLCDDGFLIYRWHHGNDALFVEGAEAISASTVRAFWAHVGSHASIADKVYARVGPADALWRLTRERDTGVEHRSLWMLRVVDAPAAIAARGFPSAVSLSVPLAITDAARPANSGRWRLTVADGQGTLDPVTSPAVGGGPPLTLGARGLAALYAGTPPLSLRQAGLACGGSPEDDAALDVAFAGTAYMLDAF
jgi:predicted acetyltransferase